MLRPVNLFSQPGSQSGKSFRAIYWQVLQEDPRRRRLFSQIGNFVRREWELLASSDQELAGEQQPDTTMKLKCNSAVVDKFRHKQNAMNDNIWFYQMRNPPKYVERVKEILR